MSTHFEFIPAHGKIRKKERRWGETERERERANWKYQVECNEVVNI